MDKNNELTEKPIPGLIRKIAIPASIGFFFNTMYNVVDTYYAGLLSTQALAALSLSFPIFFIIIAFGGGISTGTTALMANALGAGKERLSRIYATQAISFTLLVSVFLTILGILVSPDLFRILGATEAYLADSLAYMNVILLGVVFFLLAFVMNGLLNSKGDTKTFRNVLVFGFFLNIILDPWFMFGGFGLPAMGIAGVAWATVVIQALGTIYMAYKVLKADLLCWECSRMFVPRKQPFADISKQGFPASLNMMTVALGIFVITFFISLFGQSAVAAYGIATRVEQIVLLPGIGLNISALVLVGQNSGAGKFDRVMDVIIKCHKYSLAMMTVGTVIVFLLAAPIMSAFSSDPEVVEIGAGYLQIAAFLFWAYAILFLNVSALQGLKKPMFALYIGVFRQLIAPIAIFFLFVFVLEWGLYGIWWGIFLVNWTAVAITLLYARSVFKKLGKNKGKSRD
jgi:putative MATE family efflux protein